MKTFNDLIFRNVEEYSEEYFDGYKSYANIKFDKNTKMVVLSKYEPNIVGVNYTIVIYNDDKEVEKIEDCSKNDANKKILEIQGFTHSDYVNYLIELLDNYSGYKSDFDNHVDNTYKKFFEIAKRYDMVDISNNFPVDIRYGSITDVTEIIDGKVIYEWQENWRYGGHDDGWGKIPLSWIKNTEEELQKFEDECRNMREKQLMEAIDKVYQYDNDNNFNRKIFINSNGDRMSVKNDLFKDTIKRYAYQYDINDISCGVNDDGSYILLYKSNKDDKYYPFTDEMMHDYKFIRNISLVKAVENETIKVD